MSIDVTCFNWIKMIQKSDLPAYPKYVAHYLSTYMNQNQDVAWPSQSRMVSEMGIAQSTLNKALNDLEGNGWVIRERGGPVTNTRYLINVPFDAVTDIAFGGTPPRGVGSTPHGVGTPPDGAGVLRHTDTNNNINNNLIKRRFTPPTLEEVEAYCEERGNNVNPKKFIDHYEAAGWMRGKTKIKDWKACVRTWEQNDSGKSDSGSVTYL